jgi:hypothetical protein
MNKTKAKTIYPNPKFDNLQEEDAYWTNHSPLKEGYEVKVQRKPQKRSSFLTIRFKADEITQLRDFATKFDTKPSNIVRLAIKNYFNNYKSVTRRESHTDTKDNTVPPYLLNKSDSIFGLTEVPGHAGVIADRDSYYVVRPEELRDRFEALMGILGGSAITRNDKRYSVIKKIAEELSEKSKEKV